MTIEQIIAEIKQIAAQHDIEIQRGEMIDLSQYEAKIFSLVGKLNELNEKEKERYFQDLESLTSKIREWQNMWLNEMEDIRARISGKEKNTEIHRKYIESS